MGDQRVIIEETATGAQYSVPASSTKGKGAYAGKGYKVVGIEGEAGITGGAAVVEGTVAPTAKYSTKADLLAYGQSIGADVDDSMTKAQIEAAFDKPKPTQMPAEPAPEPEAAEDTG